MMIESTSIPLAQPSQLTAKLVQPRVVIRPQVKIMGAVFLADEQLAGQPHNQIGRLLIECRIRRIEAGITHALPKEFALLRE